MNDVTPSNLLAQLDRLHTNVFDRASTMLQAPLPKEVPRRAAAVTERFHRASDALSKLQCVADLLSEVRHHLEWIEEEIAGRPYSLLRPVIAENLTGPEWEFEARKAELAERVSSGRE